MWCPVYFSNLIRCIALKYLSHRLQVLLWAAEVLQMKSPENNIVLQRLSTSVAPLTVKRWWDVKLPRVANPPLQLGSIPSFQSDKCPIDSPSRRHQWCKDAILAVNGPEPTRTNAHCCQWAASSCCSNPSWAMILAKPCTIYLRSPGWQTPSTQHMWTWGYMILDKSCWIDNAVKNRRV